MAAKASSPMTESRCRSLNKLLPDLEKKLIVDNIQSHLHVDAGGFLNEVEIIEVFSGRSRVEHVRSLFTVLKTKDNAAFGSFCLILSNSGYGHWSKALMEEAGLDHDFKMTPHLDKARVNAILCKRQKMFKPTFTKICHDFNKLRNALISVLEKLPPKDFKWFMTSFNDNLRGTKKNHVEFEKSDMESPSNIMMALSLQKMYTQFDLEVFDVMVECLPEDNCSNFVKALDNYKDNVLRPLLQKTLSELADDAEVVSTHDDQKKQLSLAFVVPDDATFGTLMKARRYLEEEMEIHEVSNMRFDFGCGIVLFDIAYPIEDTRKLAESFLSDRHLQEMERLNIIVVYLLSYWAAGVADSSVYYFTECKLILKKQSNFEEPKDTERIEKLVHSLNQHVLESHSSEHILAQRLVCYLSRMEGNPDSFVNAYSELVTEVEEQKKTKVKLQEELDELSRKGGLGRRKNIADSLNVILENPQPIDDTMPTSSANPRNRGNIQEDNVQAAPKRCTII